MESILQSSLLAEAVSEEQRKVQQLRRRPADSEGASQKPTEVTPSVAELRLREQALKERQKALQEREEMLERECGCLSYLEAGIYFCTLHTF